MEQSIAVMYFALDHLSPSDTVDLLNNEPSNRIPKNLIRQIINLEMEHVIGVINDALYHILSSDGTKLDVIKARKKASVDYFYYDPPMSGPVC